MPRKYKSVVGGGYKKHDPKTIENALCDKQKGLSLRKSAEKRGLHYSIIYRHLKRGLQVSKNHGGQAALSLDSKA